MTDQWNLSPRDEELLIEITLLTDLMIAANEANGRVDPDALDVILGGPPSDGAPVSTPLMAPQWTGHPGDSRPARRNPSENPRGVRAAADSGVGQRPRPSPRGMPPPLELAVCLSHQ
jgi:hypothetical protein